MKVTIFATITCPYCRELSEYLKTHNIPFDLLYIDQDEEARRSQESESNGFLGVPFTLVEKDGQKQSVIGFDKAAIDRVLNIQS